MVLLLGVWRRRRADILAWVAVALVGVVVAGVVFFAMPRLLGFVSSRHWIRRSAAEQRADVAELDRDCPVYAFDGDCPEGWHAAMTAELTKLIGAGWGQEWWSIAAVAEATGKSYTPRTPRALCIVDQKAHARPLECCRPQTIDPHSGAGSYGPAHTPTGNCG